MNKMNKKTKFLQDIRNYLESCYRHHHELKTIKMREELNMKNFHFLDVESGDSTLSAGLCKQSTFVSKVFLKNMYRENWSVAGGFALKKDMDARNFIKKSFHQQFLDSDTPTPYMNGNLMITNDMKVFGAHWWLERKGVIIDLSADQYGHDKVIITTIDDPIYMKDNSMSSLSAIKGDQRESLMWVRNHFSKIPENKQTKNVNDAYLSLLGKYPDIEKEKSKTPEFLTC